MISRRDGGEDRRVRGNDWSLVTSGFVGGAGIGALGKQTAKWKYGKQKAENRKLVPGAGSRISLTARSALFSISAPLSQAKKIGNYL